MPAWCRETPTGVRLTVRVTPGARSNGVGEPSGTELRLRIAAPAVEGKANEELRRYLARLLGVRTSAVEVMSGSTGRTKIVEVTGCSVRHAIDACTRHN